MKKCLPALITAFIFSFSAKADFNIWASALYLNVNGTAAFYNTQKMSPPFAIGTEAFRGNLGVFGYNSGTLKILGAEINTSRDNGSAICNGALFYTIYEQGNRPANPAFTMIPLTPYCNCNAGSFNGCGNASCTGNNDQKMQNVSRSIDLTENPIGNYTLEVYYRVNGEIGSGGCGTTRFDNSNGVNYTAGFTISNPLALSLMSINGVSYNNSILMKWVMQSDADVLKYEIQKSENGLNFYPLGNVNSNQSTNISSYYFTDNNPVVGTNYYRIRAYNLNGTVNLSNVFRIYFGKVGNTIFIYPNPTGSELAVRFAAVNKGKYQMSVLNNQGQVLLTTPVNHDGTDKTIRVNLPEMMPKGIYRLFLIDKVQFYKQSFLVK